MSIKARLEADIKSAMKAGDRARLSCLRMLKSKILEREVELRAGREPGYSLSDEETVEVIAGYAKQRRDSIEGFERGGREAQACREREELEIVTGYLPEQLSEEQLRGIVQEAIAACGASSARQMGEVMKIVMPRVKGAADGKQVSRIARELLGG